jgi:dihydrofolate reductase
MRKLIEATFLSLDGVTESPGAWAYKYFSQEENVASALARLSECDALLLGRITYEELAKIASEVKGDPYFERVGGLPKFVASKTLQKSTWNATVLQGDVAEEISRLKHLPGKNIVKYGSGNLDETLIRHHLIDEFHFTIFPVVVGRGRRLFEGVDTSHLNLKLLGTTKFKNGAVTFTYSSERN